MGIGMEQPAPWLGEEWGEPPDWDCNATTYVVTGENTGLKDCCSTVVPLRKLGSEDRIRGPVQRTGSEDRIRGPDQRTGSEDRFRGPDQRTGSEDRFRGPVQRTGLEDSIRGPLRPVTWWCLLLAAGSLTFSSLMSPSSCTISSRRLSCSADMRRSSSSFLCLNRNTRIFTS
ncbi:hypothetical protein EYF80_004761 [Liparis tanakae]|uniref:Uncharacterized protein n=1 Tax=Liparis tanakae TaxID=230148 RepID=A0A4Z2J518_9TELE|nr:hypothetical protein EYF80_004761 [Liparis tanakae]